MSRNKDEWVKIKNISMSNLTTHETIIALFIVQTELELVKEMQNHYGKTRGLWRYWRMGGHVRFNHKDNEPMISITHLRKYHSQNEINNTTTNDQWN